MEHGYQEFGARGDLLDDLLLHADVVALVLAEKSAVRADTLAILYANDFKLSLVEWAQRIVVLFWFCGDFFLELDESGAGLLLLRLLLGLGLGGEAD